AAGAGRTRARGGGGGPAGASRPTVRTSRASTATNEARAANQTSSRKLIQTPIEVASARPTWASGPISAILKAILMAAPTTSAFTGVTVSPRARNVTVALRISTNGRSPAA